jgi:hypothetical protein
VITESTHVCSCRDKLFERYSTMRTRYILAEMLVRLPMPFLQYASSCSLLTCLKPFALLRTWRTTQPMWLHSPHSRALRWLCCANGRQVRAAWLDVTWQTAPDDAVCRTPCRVRQDCAIRTGPSTFSGGSLRHDINIARGHMDRHG